MDTIEAMRAFAAVAHELSFTAGARRLGLGTRVVSKHVGQLEARLGAQLLNRTTRSVSLTETGAAYLARCRPLLEQFDELEDLVRDQQRDLSGVIKISAPTGFGAADLIEALHPFQTAHPAVTIELHLSDARIALVEEGFDLAIRIGPLRDSTLTVRRLAAMPLLVCAAPAYLDRQGRPDHPAALATHDCLVGIDIGAGQTWRFRLGEEEMAVRVSGPFTANAPAALARMAALGLGVTRCPAYAVRRHIDEGRLEQLFEGADVAGFDLQALYPPNRRLTARVRALIDHLADWFKRGVAHDGGARLHT